MPGRLKVPVLCGLCVSFVALLLFLSACAGGVGTIPRGTPDTGNGTPAVMPSATATPQTALTAPANTTGNNFAFVRNNQLWVATGGAKPVQLTSFTYTNLPDVFWHQPVWSPGDHFLAFIVNANPAGLGGGGCPSPDYGANGALYLLNTSNGQFTQLALPAPHAHAQVSGAPSTDYWQYVFWQDATHLLAWYNGAMGKTSDNAGLYRYDVQAQTLTQIVPLSSLGVKTLFNAQPGASLLLSMRYSSGQLYYQVVAHPFEQQSQLAIYSRSLAKPQAQSVQVLSMGSEPWCASQQAGPYTYPGWDIAPDGQQLAAQMIAVAGGQGVSTIQSLSLTDHSSTNLFAQLPANLLAHDLALTWGPDSQQVVATALQAPDQGHPYSASLANPAATQQYDLNLAGQVAWRPDSSAFALQSAQSADATAKPDVYVFLTGDTHGRVLLADAYNFAWG